MKPRYCSNCRHGVKIEDYNWYSTGYGCTNDQAKERHYRNCPSWEDEVLPVSADVHYRASSGEVRLVVAHETTTVCSTYRTDQARQLAQIIMLTKGTEPRPYLERLAQALQAAADMAESGDPWSQRGEWNNVASFEDIDDDGLGGE